MASPASTRSGRNISPASNCLPYGVQSGNEAMMNGIERRDALGDCLETEFPGVVRIAIDDGLLHFLEELILHEDLASSGNEPRAWQIPDGFDTDLGCC